MTVRGVRFYGLAVAAVGAGIAAATLTGAAVAWADTTGQSEQSTSTPGPSTPESNAGPTTTGLTNTAPKNTGPKKPDRIRIRHQERPTSATADTKSSEATTSTDADPPRRKSLAARLSSLAPRQDAVAKNTAEKASRTTGTVRTTVLSSVSPQPVVTAAAPSPPGPLSPIAEIAAAPGRIVNAALQVLDITSSVNGLRSPIDFDPLDEAVFSTFRRLEDAVGLYKKPAVQPVVLKETYTLPESPEKTPTVTQFLNAAAGEYVLGGTPGGLKPFTVDGKQMTSTNVLSGQSSKAWVTPDGQIIIAYQGTTGGTNLLFNPLIAISQVLTDVQIIFTDTTPQAFTDALAFEREVEAAAAAQGYDKSDIFVTGHSLGGWEAQYVAQQTGLSGIGFEGPGLNTTVPGNGAESNFVNIETYGDPAAYMSSDLPGLQPFAPPYVPGGGSKPHYGSIIMIGDPDEALPLINASSMVGLNPIGNAIFAVVLLGNFFQHHLPGMQAYNLGVTPDPGVVPWLGTPIGTVNERWGDMTIPELKAAASAAGVLITP